MLLLSIYHSTAVNLLIRKTFLRSRRVSVSSCTGCVNQRLMSCGFLSIKHIVSAMCRHYCVKNIFLKLLGPCKASAQLVPNAVIMCHCPSRVYALRKLITIALIMHKTVIIIYDRRHPCTSRILKHKPYFPNGRIKSILSHFKIR